MIIEYSVEDLKNYYSYDYEDNDNKYLELEEIISNEIDNNNINSDILHVFPIFIAVVSYAIGLSYLLI
jgi:hypothetical protein